ncbi:flagellar biosynthesis component FlhA [Paenibacillus sp. BK720]|nr:flagellar biosynthesis component FlhA [Paenibacillus sp. BK720]
MMKMNSSIIMLVLVVCMIFAGCTKANTESEPINTELSATNISTNEPSDSNSNTNQSDLVGSVKVENLGSDTKITYTFKNQSEKMVTVIGGARYKLLKDNNVVDEGGVPIKDYIDLEPGQDYTDEKTFLKLEPGSYTIHVDWNKTIISAEFVRN